MTVRPDLVSMRRGVADRLGRIRRLLARATGWPFAVRVGVFLAALAAQAFTYPPGLLLGGQTVVVVVAAALPALWPRTAVVSWFWLVTAMAWLTVTTLYGGTGTLPRLIGVTCALYLVHTGAALAAVLPYDAVVAPELVIRWLVRAGLVLLVSVGLAVFGLFQSVRLGEHTYLAATVIGLGLTVGVAWLLAVAGARRR